MANKNRNAERERFWRGVLARFAKSGRQVREFCRDNRLSEPSFYAWRRTIAERDAEKTSGRLARRQAAPRRRKTPAFLPVVMRQDALPPLGVSTTAITVELRGGRVLRLPESIPAERLAAIVIALEPHAAAEADA